MSSTSSYGSDFDTDSTTSESGLKDVCDGSDSGGESGERVKTTVEGSEPTGETPAMRRRFEGNARPDTAFRSLPHAANGVLDTGQ